MKIKSNYDVWAAVENFSRSVAPHYSKDKLKGAGRAPRMRLSRVVNYNAQVPRLLAVLRNAGVPPVRVSIYRGRGYGGPVDFVSVPLGKALRALFLA